MLHVNTFADADTPESGLSARDSEGRITGNIDGNGPTSIEVSSDLQSLEQEWRTFERHADCTPFQSYDWLSTWQTCIGTLASVKPFIIIGRGHDGDILFLLPLAIEKFGILRRLVFLGRDLCDYNAPLLAPNLQETIAPSQFVLDVQRACAVLLTANDKYDLVFFDKMPEVVGRQANPMLELGTTPNASGAHSTSLADDWQEFYTAKRSSSTRRRDRTKRRRLSAHGDVQFVTPGDAPALNATLQTLIVQKTAAFSRMGVGNLFERPGHSTFYVTLANDARSLAHVSYIAVGATTAATNLGLQFRGCYYHILASYCDGPLAQFGPGALHLRELMRYAIERGCERFDFTIGDENYKREWADDALALYDHISASSRPGRIAALWLTLALQSKRYIKHSPELWKCVGIVRSLIARMRSRKATPSGNRNDH
jgi:CelD/BcsL family acetyltransferase involved in cellulose biosynthesis